MVNQNFYAGEKSPLRQYSIYMQVFRFKVSFSIIRDKGYMPDKAKWVGYCMAKNEAEAAERMKAVLTAAIKSPSINPFA